MAIEYFLKLDGIKSDSLSIKHKGEIELKAWSLGAANATSISGSGLSAGKVSFSDITITKDVDSGSAKLLELCCSGKHIPNGVLTCAKSTGDKNPADYLTLKFEEIHISSFQTGGSHGDDVGTESISFAFAKITYDFKVQNKDGTLSAAGTTTHDQTARETSS